jgi:hypothetical protein
MMPTTRRNLLRSSSAATLLAVGAATGQLTACPSTSTNVLPAVLDMLQKAVATVCPIVPAVSTLVAVIAASFPQAAGVASITEDLANQIAASICKAVGTSGAATASGKLGESFKATFGGKEIAINGFKTPSGQNPVWF